MTDRIRGRRLQRIRQSVLRSNPLCVHCQTAGRITVATQVDHIVALVNGGTDTDDNRQPLCDACHERKTRDDLGQRVRTGATLDGTPADPTHHWHR